MLNRLVCLVLFCGAASALLHAQSTPTEAKSSAQIGVGFTAANTDFGGGAIKGISIYGSLEVAHHFGITGEINELKQFTPDDIGEATYLYGVRYSRDIPHFHPYAKALFGLGTFEYQQGIYPATTALHFTTYAIGGGIDYTFSRRINLRLFDLEYQFLPQFKPNGLNPYQGTFGAAYRF
jgi:hypothetical protein